MKTYKVRGRAFQACGPACADGFKTDRRYGAIYGPNVLERLTDGRVRLAKDREEWSRTTKRCAYCGAGE